MKKRWMAMLLSALMLAMLWIPASAAGERGYYGISMPAGVTAVADGEKLNVTYDKAEKDAYYIVLLVKKGANLSSLEDADIYYINQETASGTTVSFTVYPTLPTTGNLDFDLYITTNAGGGATAAQGSVSYGEESGGALLGDVDGDGVAGNAKDRTYLARYVAKWPDYQEGGKNAIIMANSDLDGDGKVNAKDRTILARHVAKWTGYEVFPVK